MLQAADSFFDQVCADYPRRFKSITSNGIELDLNKALWLKARDYLFGLSIDGTRQAHELHRPAANGQSSYDAALRALDILLQSELRHQLLLVVNPDTTEMLVQGIEALYAQGARRFSINLNYLASWSEAAIVALETALSNMALLYADYRRQGKALYINVFDSKFQVIAKKGYSPCGLCGFGHNELVVAPSGNLYPCDRFVGNDDALEWCIGTVSKGIDQAQLKRISTLKQQPAAECANCFYRRYCVHWCACANFQASGHPGKVSPLQCRTEKHLIDIAMVMSGKAD